MDKTQRCVYCMNLKHNICLVLFRNSFFSIKRPYVHLISNKSIIYKVNYFNILPLLSFINSNQKIYHINMKVVFFNTNLYI